MRRCVSSPDETLRRAMKTELTNFQVFHLVIKHRVECLILLLKQNDFFKKEKLTMQKGVVRKCLRFFTLYNIETFRDRVFEMILISFTKSVHYILKFSTCVFSLFFTMWYWFMKILKCYLFSLLCRRGVVIVKESKTKWIYVVKTVRTYSYEYHKMSCLPYLYVLFSQYRLRDNTLGNLFFQISFYSRAYLRIIYEKTMSQVPLGPLLGKQNIKTDEDVLGLII